jgi:hypothetical protein
MGSTLLARVESSRKWLAKYTEGYGNRDRCAYMNEIYGCFCKEFETVSSAREKIFER